MTPALPAEAVAAVVVPARPHLVLEHCLAINSVRPISRVVCEASPGSCVEFI